jgi:competence protein ComEC
MPLGADAAGLAEGRWRAARAADPLGAALPGAYDAARQAWFDGIAATGTVAGPVTVVTPLWAWLTRCAMRCPRIARSGGGSAGGIAAALPAGTRRHPLADEQAMRDWADPSAVGQRSACRGDRGPMFWRRGCWRCSRGWRCDGVAGGGGSRGGALAYALLTGAQVPTVRSLLGAAGAGGLALGRQPLSLACWRWWRSRHGLMARGGGGPSFQMSFGAVLVIGVVSDCAPVRAFLAPRDEAGWRRIGRHRSRSC